MHAWVQHAAAAAAICNTEGFNECLQSHTQVFGSVARLRLVVRSTQPNEFGREVCRTLRTEHAGHALECIECKSTYDTATIWRQHAVAIAEMV